MAAVIFDLDGTLIDSADDILACLASAIGSAGHPLPPLGREHVGPPLRELLSLVLPEASPSQRAEVGARFMELYDSSGFPRTRVYGGVPDLLREQSAQGRCCVARPGTELVALNVA